MAHRLGITGMDSSTEAELRSAFAKAQARLDSRWELVPEAEADHVVVDMDSMYGPMSWIRLHAAGKQVIGLTTSPRTQADHRLARPFDTDAFAALLASISGETPDSSRPAPPAKVEEAQPAAPASAAEAEPEARPADVKQESVAPDAPAAAPESAAPPAQAPEAPRAKEPPPAPTARGFADWLAPGALSGRWRLARGDASVAFDADTRSYHGPAALKPLAALFEGSVAREDFEPLDAAAWSAAATGEAQPLARLQWYGGLLAGKGALLPGNDPDGRYRLLKWPQTEREFPKHFRIATAMMKGPATLDEAAAASGVTHAEVADFVNANLATGYAEFVPPAPPEPVEQPRPGLFGRLRGR